MKYRGIVAHKLSAAAAAWALVCVVIVFATIARAQGLLPTRGLWVGFERRGWAAEYWNGQVIQQFNDFDSIVGHKVSDEVALQLDAMRGMGVNTISFPLVTADQDGDHSYPLCHNNPVGGFQWPQPTATELTNLGLFFDLVQSKGMKVILILTNTHMEEQPPANSQTWLGAILNVVKNHPALDLVVFYGDAHTIDTNGDGIPDSCGGQSEPPLWLGPSAVAASYVKWAISYAMSLGMPASKLSAASVVGNYFTDSQPPAGPDATDQHLWSPIVVMKSIFDSLNIPANQRVYALSFYEHSKCATAQSLPCTDSDAPTWAEETLRDVLLRVGRGPRIVAVEMGNLTPVDPVWSTSQGLESLIRLMSQYGTDGGSFWRWTSFVNSEDSDPTLAQPVKQRGTSFTYNPVKDVLQCYYTGQCTAPAPINFTTLANISTRGFVGTGDAVMIGGFIIGGSADRTVLVRAIGPSLSSPPINLANTLQDPTISLFASNGAKIISNDNWADASNAQSIPFGLRPGNNSESAVLLSLAPGAYTAIVSGVNGGTGIGLVEVFDLNAAVPGKLGNISTRALVETGDGVMIGGFIVSGPDNEKVVIRAIGPSLADPPFNLSNVLRDPSLALFNDQGQRIQFNDDWQSDQRDEIIATGLQPSNLAESAIVQILAPGNYTAIVNGVNSTTGIALVEVYGLN
ncbi:MAG TPA: hypothetical protein VGH08_04660 [Chthoniobacterales bacterium]